MNEPSKTKHLSAKVLHRTRSSRALYRQLDTSEFISSPHESIWDADAIHFDDGHVENIPTPANGSSVSIIHPRADLSPLSPLELLDELTDLSVQPQKSIRLSQPRPRTMYHQSTRLEPIVEQRSYASLASSLSRARLAPSPGKTSMSSIHNNRTIPFIHGIGKSLHGHWRKHCQRHLMVVVEPFPWTILSAWTYLPWIVVSAKRAHPIRPRNTASLMRNTLD